MFDFCKHFFGRGIKPPGSEKKRVLLATGKKIWYTGKDHDKGKDDPAVEYQNVTLIGMPGSGKSTVGVLLAKTLGYRFVDADLLIQQREGALLQDILDQRGVEGFLDVEEAVIRDLDCTGTVIAPGGSAICRQEAARHLKELGLVVYLHVPLEELERRIRNITTRGIAMEPGQTLADVYAIREPLYRKYADLTVDVAGESTLEQTVAAVVARLG